ncbi:MAG: M48 family metalloprotease [Candidatus Gracilibacteria bacterium]|nr:M48 family metalloprotease [Candidatus Gracilibacteria bacterium]MDD4530289.1 M48 family metalloprotease [Candidatus Gracilibacteria bacterium]
MKNNIPNIPDDYVNPLKPDLNWFFKMIGIVIGLLIFAYLLSYLFANLVISNFSLETEKKYFGNFYKGNGGSYQKFDKTILSYNIKIPDYIDIYIIDKNEINAFATIGGNILVTKELLKKIDYEEELIFIIGHEINHVMNRAPIRTLTTNIPFYLTLMFLGLNTNVDYSKIYSITSAYTSRDAEKKADDGGLNFVKEAGGDNSCVLNFFKKDSNYLEKYLYFSSSHPTDAQRIQNIKESIGNQKLDLNKCKKLKK